MTIINDSVVYEGKEYHRDSKGAWRDSDNVKVYEGLQKTLNKEWAKKNDIVIDSMLYEELVANGDKFKNACDYSMAIKCYEKALDFRREERMYIMASLSACYRGNKQPEKSLELYDKYKVNRAFITAPFLTSVAAACLDSGNVKMAKNLADRAYALSGGNAEEELKNVYSRIRNELKKG